MSWGSKGSDKTERLREFLENPNGHFVLRSSDVNQSRKPPRYTFQKPGPVHTEVTLQMDVDENKPRKREDYHKVTIEVWVREWL